MKSKIIKGDVSSQKVRNIVNTINKYKKNKIAEIIEMKSDTFKDKIEKATAFCEIIAYYTGDNKEIIRDVFNAFEIDEKISELGKSDDFMYEIITDAIERCGGKFKENTGKLPFISVNENGKEIIHAKLFADYFCENNYLLNVKNNDDTFTELYKYKEGVYERFAYDDFCNYAIKLLENVTPGLVKTVLFAETYSLIRMKSPLIFRNELDSDETIINCKSGLVKITANGIIKIPHSPKVYSTIQLPFEWKDELIETPKFDEFMKTFTGDRKELIDLLLEFIGVTISNIRGSRLKSALFIVGDGDTGKSVLKSLTERLLGERNHSDSELQDLEARFGTSTAYRKRLVGSSDMKVCSVKELNNFKKMTGGDSIHAEYKGKDAFHFKYNGTLWFCCNKLPHFGGDTGTWVYNRMLIVRVRNVIPKEEQDSDLVNKLLEERDGIVQKLIFAVQRVISNGYRYDIPECVIAEREAYSHTNNSALTFIEKYLCDWGDTPKRGSAATTGFIYKTYRSWHKDNYHGICATEIEFKNEVAKHFKVKDRESLVTRVNGNSYYKDCTLKVDALHDFGEMLHHE